MSLWPMVLSLWGEGFHSYTSISFIRGSWALLYMFILHEHKSLEQNHTLYRDFASFIVAFFGDGEKEVSPEHPPEE